MGESISSDLQAVFPYHTMEAVVRQAERFAVAHCPCRMAAKITGRACEHPIEVCLKFDDLADYLIERGLGREITREEALDIIKQAEEAGLVHFVDNAEGQVKHNCNCCGCSCWNVGSIRRRKIARDDLMATYFMRTTDEDACVGCGACARHLPGAGADRRGRRGRGGRGVVHRLRRVRAPLPHGCRRSQAARTTSTAGPQPTSANCTSRS